MSKQDQSRQREWEREKNEKKIRKIIERDEATEKMAAQNYIIGRVGQVRTIEKYGTTKYEKNFKKTSSGIQTPDILSFIRYLNYHKIKRDSFVVIRNSGNIAIDRLQVERFRNSFKLNWAWDLKDCIFYFRFEI